jgi:hypothetical protein
METVSKFLLPLVGIGIVAVAIIFYITSGNNTGIKGTNIVQNKNNALTVDFNTQVCDQIPKNIVERALGKAIIETKPTSGNITNVCDYFTNKENHITIRLNKLNYENQESGQSGMKDIKIETDLSIGAEHFIVIPTQQQTIVNILIKVNDNLLLTVENGLSTEYSKKQIIAVASDVVKYLISNSSDLDNLNESNNNEESAKDQGNQSDNQSQQELVNDFFTKLAKHEIQDALALMDANDNTKQAWGVNFNTIKKLTVKKIEETFKEEWSENRQSFKIELNVEIKPEGEQMGWQNGTNFRWVSLEKNSDGKWLIHELANNP